MGWGLAGFLASIPQIPKEPLGFTHFSLDGGVQRGPRLLPTFRSHHPVRETGHPSSMIRIELVR